MFGTSYVVVVQVISDNFYLYSHQCEYEIRNGAGDMWEVMHNDRKIISRIRRVLEL